MTETNDATATEESSVSTDSTPTDSTGPAATDPIGPKRADFELRGTLYRGALALFVLLAVIAVAQLYASVGATINTFIAQEYRPLFRMAFNLVVLLAAGIGISWTVRQLSGE